MEIFNKNCEEYDAWYDRNNFAYLSELESIKKVLPKKGKGLEIGVGTGRFAAPLGIFVGVDCSSSMLKIAEKRAVNVLGAFGEQLPFLNNTFDYTAIIITLCFVNDHVKVLKEAARVLKKNGKIVIGIVDKNSFLGKYYQKKKSIFYKHAHFFGVDELHDLLIKTGFGEITCYQSLFDLPDKITSIETPKKDFGKGGFVVIGARKLSMVH
ncbi:MAG: class I SAM-dependent methyltransferase [Candidatus Ancaeobacter aquaticus]|nr:class I SAM-dependent methyltransferase [Candidatus Ancaeobacter aquaticus]